jgi:hypothetical protein
VLKVSEESGTVKPPTTSNRTTSSSHQIERVDLQCSERIYSYNALNMIYGANFALQGKSHGRTSPTSSALIVELDLPDCLGYRDFMLLPATR